MSRFNNQLFEKLTWQRPRPEEEFFAPESSTCPTRREREREGAFRIQYATNQPDAGIGTQTSDYAQGTLGEESATEQRDHAPAPPLSNMAASRATRPRLYSPTYATTHALPVLHQPVNANQVARKLVSTAAQLSYNKGAARSVLDQPQISGNRRPMTAPSNSHTQAAATAAEHMMLMTAGSNGHTAGSQTLRPPSGPRPNSHELQQRQLPPPSSAPLPKLGDGGSHRKSRSDLSNEDLQVHEITVTSFHPTSKPPIPPLPQFSHKSASTPNTGTLPIIVPPSPTPSSTVPYLKPPSPPGGISNGPRGKLSGRQGSASPPPPSPHNPHSRQHIVPRGSKEALTQELQQISARTGQPFAALQKDAPKPRPASGPPGWTPAHGLWKDPEKMSQLQEAGMTYEQIRHAEWERNSHTNKVSRLLRLGAESPALGSTYSRSRQGSDAGEEQLHTVFQAGLENVPEAEEGQAKRGNVSCEDGEGPHALTIIADNPISPDAGAEINAKPSHSEALHSPEPSQDPAAAAAADAAVAQDTATAAQAVAHAGQQADVLRMQRTHIDDQLQRLRTRPGLYNPRLRTQQQPQHQGQDLSQTASRFVSGGAGAPLKARVGRPLSPIHITEKLPHKQEQQRQHLKQALAAVAERDKAHQKMLRRAARHAARKAAAQATGEELQGRDSVDSRAPSQSHEAQRRVSQTSDAAEQRLGSASGSSRSSNTSSRSGSRSRGSSSGCSSSHEGREGLEGGSHTESKGRELLEINGDEGQQGEGEEAQQRQEGSSSLQEEGRESRGFGKGGRRSRKRRTVALREEGSASSLSPERCAGSPSIAEDGEASEGISRMSSRGSSPRKNSRRQSMHSQKSRKIERRQSCLNVRSSSGRNQLGAQFAHMNQVTRRLGLARSRAQSAPTPAVIKRPEDLIAAAASVRPADQGTRPAEAEDALSANGGGVTSRSTAEREALHELAQQALQDGLFVQDPLTMPDNLPDEEHDKRLRTLKDVKSIKESSKTTFSRLLKPASNSVANPLQLEGQGGWNPAQTLNWSSRGIGPGKMGALKQKLMSNANVLTGLQLAGNNLDNNCIMELLLILGDPKAPRITQLDLAVNTTLTWQCTRALSVALGASPASDDGGSQSQAPEPKISPLCLKRLLLSGTKLGDKGASEMASALRHNKSLKSLSLSRCGIGDTGGRALMNALATNTTLASLDVSWNALRGDSARMLSEALLQNGGIQHLDLSHNGFSDADAARIIKALSEHGHWRHVDLSYNNVGAGAAMVLGSLAKKLAEASARSILKNRYAQGWDPEVQAGFIDYSGWFDPDPIHGHSGHHQVTFQQPLRESDSSQPSVPDPSSTGNDAAAAAANAANAGGRGGPANATINTESNSNPDAPNKDSSVGGAANTDPPQAPVPTAKPPPTPPPPATSAPAGKQSPALLGAQLTHGPLLLDLGGNPLGTSGSLQVLEAFDECSKELEGAEMESRQRRAKARQEQRAQRAEQAAALVRASSMRKHKPRYSFYDASQGPPKPEAIQGQEQLQPEAINHEDSFDKEEEEMLPWPLYVSIQGCNVMISDSLQEDAHVTLSGGAQRDPYSPNPFLQSIVTIMQQDQAQGKKSKGAPKSDGKGSKSAKGKKGDNGPSKEYVFTAESQAIDTTSPAGLYKLDLSHPASAVIVSKILGLRTKLTELAAAGKATPGVGVAVKDITINDKPIKIDRLEAAADVPSGILSMNVSAPSLLLASDPWPIKDAVVGWMLETLEERGAGDLFKLAVIDVACSHFYFSAPQALQMLDLFDPEMSSSERLHAAEVLYTRCYNPLDFWEAALPELTEMQVEAIKHSLGELGALNIQNPSGRFMLNLSRSIDRLMALRLQAASAFEAPWDQHRYFINWRNAQLNGVPLDPEGLAKKLRDYSIPAAGTLKIDYVMYQVPNPETDEPCADDDLWDLKQELRALHREHVRTLESVRAEFFPFGLTLAERNARAEKAAAATAAASNKKGGQEATPPMKKKFSWGAARMLSMHVSDMVRIMVEDQQVAMSKVPTAPPPSSITAAETFSPFPQASKAAPPLIMPRVNHNTTQQQPPEDEASGIWWAGTGFNPKPMQKRQAERDAAAQEALREVESQMALAREAAALLDTARGKTSVSPPTSAGSTKKDGKEEAAAAKAPPKKGKDKDDKKKDDKKDKGDKKKDKDDKKKDAGRKWKGEGKALPRPVPSQRYPGAYITPEQQMKAEEQAVRLLALSRASDVQLVLSRYSLVHTARVFQVFLLEDPAHGPQVCARLVEMLPPLAAVFYVHDMFDAQVPLLPVAIRRQILSALRPNVVKVLDTVQRLVNRSGLKRARQIRCALQVFAAHHFITSAQLAQILRVLRYEQDRGTAFVALWSRVTDREGLFDTWQELGVEEQRQVQQRLGHWHVWTTLARPNGLHMYLDIKEPEQHDIARDVVKMAVKESLKSKAAARKQGQLQGSQQLANLHGNGQLLLMPEDDKTWSMLESSYNTLEFDFVPNTNQSNYKTSKAAQSIQWKWLTFNAARNKVTKIVRAPAPAAALPTMAQMPQGSSEGGDGRAVQQQVGEGGQDQGTVGGVADGEMGGNVQ